MIQTRKLLTFLMIAMSVDNVQPVSVLGGVNMALGTTLAFSVPTLLQVSMFGSSIPSKKDRERFDLLEESLKPENALPVPRSQATILKKNHSLMKSKVSAILKRVQVEQPDSVRCYPFNLPGQIMGASGAGQKRMLFYEVNYNNLFPVLAKEQSLSTGEEEKFTPDQVQEKYELRVIEGAIGHEGRHLVNHDSLIAGLILLGTPTVGILTNLYFKGELPRIPMGLSLASLSWILTALYLTRAEKRADLESCKILGANHTRAMSRFYEVQYEIASETEIELQTHPTLYKLLTMHPPHLERRDYLQALADEMSTQEA